ncbi:MAG: oxidoreductase [Deltaproteobacteria bacterium]|nr:oxidoreductase [Deltaproteobacteria bacterium]
MHTLLFLNPGHFHAGLVLRKSHPRLSNDIFVYSEAGPDLDRFIEMVESFNRRSKDSTRWQIHTRTGGNCLQRLIDEKKGDIVVLAGKNNTRMESIETLNRAGYCVLADKPWVTTESALPYLTAAMADDRPLTLDIMTERFEITAVLLKRFIAQKDVFGTVRIDEHGSPSVYKETVHHLYKIVNEQPLVRPAWFFDIHVQGEGIIDVSTHLVDMIHWMLFPGTAVHFKDHIELIDARRWPTEVPLEMFKKITRLDAFPDSLSGYVTGESLDYFCNGDIFYRVKGVPVHIRVLWNLEVPEGGADMHYSYIKGSRSDLLIRQRPESGYRKELLIIPKDSPSRVEQAVKTCLSQWTDEYPGLSVQRENDKLLIHIPDELRTTHEEHFCQVRDTFLEYLDTGFLPPETRACIVAKYTLLTKAREKALVSPFKPMEVLINRP